MEGHLVVVLHCGVLFVGRLQRTLGDVVHLQRMDEQGGIIKLALVRPVISCESGVTLTTTLLILQGKLLELQQGFCSTKTAQ